MIQLSLLRIINVQDRGLVFIAMKIQPRSYAFVINNRKNCIARTNRVYDIWPLSILCIANFLTEDVSFGTRVNEA